MSGYENTGDKKYNGDLKVNLSAGDNKIKYYECGGDNCIFEILDDKLCNNIDNNKCCDFNHKEKEINCECSNNGRIVVKSIIDCGRQEILKGVKINLYKINGLSPILVKSKLTNEEGEVVFSNIEDGSYRIIEIIDKEYFEKPKYINWNEITIDCNNKKEKILIVNKLKKYIGKHN
ncbi:prealbumin-like fold domain-containing protein [uncultured Clostridium sp.]|uniref:prealbumin-like fold domain-containing protein n=1 Tax=uncultured Clostridium sp. TaxID=59620 RepID=UPI0025E80E42|nr:prealbumin-like fold domain-containing protein [uncultured Clostridium sp.]